MLDSLVRVSRRGEETHFASILLTTVYTRTSHIGIRNNFLPPNTLSLPTQTHAGTRMTTAPISLQYRKYSHTNTEFLRFLLSNFRYSLTLFSKFFASFPHGTCTLSVFHRYLALDGIYHPFRAAIPNNSTRRRHLP